MTRLSPVAVSALLVLLAVPARSQVPIGTESEMFGSPAELAAVAAVAAGRYVRARELAEELLRLEADSIPAHYALGAALHFGEANLPRALYVVRRGRALVEQRAGPRPLDPVHRHWYFWLLTEEAWTAGEMDLREEQLATFVHRDEVFGEAPGDRIWALIKLERYDEARAVIARAVEHESPSQRLRGLNGLCALEFEVRNREGCFSACVAACETFQSSQVVCENAGESAQLVFRLDDAERYYTEATQRFADSYSSPWRPLAVLYLAEGRFGEAFASLERAQRDRRMRPPHTLQQDQAATEMAVVELLLAAGRGLDASRIAQRISLQPDRTGGTSTTAEQMELKAVLLRWTALQARIEEIEEQAPAASWWRRLLPDQELMELRLARWFTGRRAVALLSDPTLRVTNLRPRLTGVVGAEPWVLPAAFRVLGAGVALQALTEARHEEDHPGAEPYFNAFEAEARWLLGDHGRALELAAWAVRDLPPGEVLLRARVAAVGGAAAGAPGLLDRRAELWHRALEDFPAVFRLLGLSLPLVVDDDGTELGRSVADAVYASPRFHRERGGLRLEVKTQGAEARICLYRRFGVLHGCRVVETSGDAPVAEIVAEVHQQLLSPKLDLSQRDMETLDGSPSAGRLRSEIDDVIDGAR